MAQQSHPLIRASWTCTCARRSKWNQTRVSGPQNSWPINEYSKTSALSWEKYGTCYPSSCYIHSSVHLTWKKKIHVLQPGRWWSGELTQKPSVCAEKHTDWSTFTHVCAQGIMITLAPTFGFNKIASRCGAPRPPMTDVGTETAFRLDQRKHFRKSKHLLRSEVSWCDLHLRRSTWHCTSE